MAPTSLSRLQSLASRSTESINETVHKLAKRDSSSGNLVLKVVLGVLATLFLASFVITLILRRKNNRKIVYLEADIRKEENARRIQEMFGEGEASPKKGGLKPLRLSQALESPPPAYYAPQARTPLKDPLQPEYPMRQMGDQRLSSLSK